MNPFHRLFKGNIKQVDAAIVTTLSRAVRSSNINEIKRLLREGVRSDSEDTSGRLPICVAAETGNSQALELFLADVSPNVRDHGRPPLFFSSAQLHQECIKLLIEAGADTNLATSHHKYFRRDFSELGSTPLHAAMLAYTPASRTTMDRRIPEAFDLPPDVQRRKEVCIELLLKAGSNPAIQNEQGISPLSLALDHQSELFSKYTKQCKIDCIIVNPKKGWPVFIASRIRATGLVAFGVNSEESVAEWKYNMLKKCASKVILLAEGDGTCVSFERWSGESALDLCYDLDKSISDFATIESVWCLVSRYLDLPDHQNDSLFGLRNHPKEYDVFVSYKSEDVIPARKLAESLLQNGQSVWMAEYEVLLTGQSAFQTAINEGLAASRQAIFFSNFRFAESAYCQMEVILAMQLIGISDILEIKIPDEQHCFSSLFQSRQIRGLVWDDKNPDESVSAVCELLALPNFNSHHSASVADAHSMKDLFYRDLLISFNIGRWLVQPVELNLWENVASTVAEFTMPCSGATLTGRLMIMDASFGIPVSEDGNSEFDTPFDDDREVARITRRCFANQHRFTSQFECKGAHTWPWKGKMMPAFTWFQAPHLIEPHEISDAAVDSSWDLLRQYSVIVDHPISGIPLECRFQFMMRDTSDDMDRRFRKFLQYAEEMQQIASSLSLSQQRESAPFLGRSSESIEQAIRRAISVMALVQRAYTEDEYAQADTVRKRILDELQKPVNAWIKNDGIARYFSPREKRCISMPLVF